VRRAATLLACLLGAVVVAGCGNGGGGGSGPLSKEDYEQQMQALQEDLGASANELQQAFSDPQDVDAMSEGLNDAADLLDEASQSLDDIAPPEDVADAHQAMVDRSAAAAEKLREFADTVANASLAELQESLAEFQNIEEFTELQAAVSEIESKGYNIGGS
jgi:DNA repair ATPase RecN